MIYETHVEEEKGYIRLKSVYQLYIVFCLTRARLEPTIYRTRVEHANRCTTVWFLFKDYCFNCIKLESTNPLVNSSRVIDFHLAVFYSVNSYKSCKRSNKTRNELRAVNLVITKSIAMNKIIFYTLYYVCLCTILLN
jgi:hypothetical protein